MFREINEDNILKELLDRVSPNIDKREGSIVYDQLKPVALKLAEAYSNLDMLLNMMFLDTTSGEYLIKAARDRGILIKEATSSERAVTIEGTKPLRGSRFFTGDIYWKYTKDNTVECETPGLIGNSIPQGTKLIPISSITGLVSITLGDILVSGSDREDEEVFRDRVISLINAPQVNNNKNQVKIWATSQAGVGDAVVVPHFNGPGTTLVYLLSPEGLIVSKELVDRVKNVMDPVDSNGNDGLGNGLCDIGCKTTIKSAIAKNININCTITKSPHETLDNIKTKFHKSITDYFRSIAFKESQVVYTRLTTLLSNIPGVLDYNIDTFLVNSQKSNIPLAVGETPTLVEVTITI